MDKYQGQPSAALQKHQTERACAQLLGLIAGITADGQLHDLEIQFLRTWLSSNQQASTHWLGSRLAAQIDHALADGHVSEEARATLMAALQGAAGVQFAETGSVTPEVVAFPADDCTVQLQGATVCLTGKFHFGSRSECELATVASGASFAGSVTRKVHYLVIGSAGATASWKQATYGAKIDAAMKLKEKGHPIFIVPEELWHAGLTKGLGVGAECS